MNRIFFDVAKDTRILYDYQGREFEQPEQARKFAELVALDLGCTAEIDWTTAEVQVRNVSGRRLFSIPIGAPDQIAA